MIGRNNHITAVNKIEIGDCLLTGQNVTITDNSHGNSRDKSIIDTNPREREVFSKGGVIIGKNVWIGDNAIILPNVTIGDGAIIGANTVVTSDIPRGGVAVGAPARVVRILE